MGRNSEPKEISSQEILASSDESSEILEPSTPKAPSRWFSLIFPFPVYLILANEICERFSYYGIHAILIVYLTNVFMLDKHTSILIYHIFNMLCYFSPILGGVIADCYWGRFKTIVYISIIYTIGSIMLAVTSIPYIVSFMKIYGPLFALFLIALGTGGIKPCVSAFGADQFSASETDKIASYFSLFYFCINLGSLASMIITPALRSDVRCFEEDCYLLAFGVPAGLMAVSIVLFLAGSPFYKDSQPQENILLLVVKVTSYSVYKKITQPKSKQPNHWLEWGYEICQRREIIRDIASVLRVLVLFVPLPIFWALFDQQGSRWTIQAMEMKGDAGYFGVIKPDQMQALNPILVLVLIPLFESALYPVLKKFNLLSKPLQKMGFGMFLAALSFYIAALIQIKMEEVSPIANLPATGYANLRIINALPETIHINSLNNICEDEISIEKFRSTEYFSANVESGKFSIVVTSNTSGIKFKHKNRMIPVNLMEHNITQGNFYSLIITTTRSNGNAGEPEPEPELKMQVLNDYVDIAKNLTKIRFIAILSSKNIIKDSLNLNVGEMKLTLQVAGQNPLYISVPSGKQNVVIDGIWKKTVNLREKSVITVLLELKNDATEWHEFYDMEPRTISILWQIPQYVLITMGEVFFSVTGLDFAYSESPESMKSTVMAAWLCTVSIGNMIVVLLAGVQLTQNMAMEFVIFGSLLIVTTILFAVIAKYYTPYKDCHLEYDASPVEIG